MITKTQFWTTIREQLKDIERSKKITQTVMEKIKEIPQHEDKTGKA
jgi:hypothetical protein